MKIKVLVLPMKFRQLTDLLGKTFHQWYFEISLTVLVCWGEIFMKSLEDCSRSLGLRLLPTKMLLWLITVIFAHTNLCYISFVCWSSYHLCLNSVDSSDENTSECYSECFLFFRCVFTVLFCFLISFLLAYCLGFSLSASLFDYLNFRQYSHVSLKKCHCPISFHFLNERHHSLLLDIRLFYIDKFFFIFVI
jgi:hypothetical protein